MPEASVGVYYANQPSDSTPSYPVSRSEARELKQAGKGFFINHGKDLRLIEPMESPSDDRNPQDAHVKARDRSCQMPGAVTEEAVLLEKYSAIQLVRGWAPQYRFA